MTPFHPKRAVVVGLGKSGRGAIALLGARGCEVTAIDDKAEVADAAELQARGVTLRLGGFPSDFWVGADVVVVSPGVPLARPELRAARAAGAQLIGEIELAARFLPPGAGPILGVTGTNGKSTTTALLGELMAKTGKSTFVGGNLGRPFSEACEKPWQVHVVELSSFQLEGVEDTVIRGGAILNLQPDHLDRYATAEAYGAAKARIWKNTPRDGFAVVNADDPQVLALGRQAKVPLYAFTLDAQRTNAGFKGAAVALRDGFTFAFGEGLTFTVKNRALRGAHNLQNAMAASLMAHLAGAGAQAIQQGLDCFPGLPHRLEFVREQGGVEWINDSKATNVDSSLVALRALAGRVWLIAGGKGKGAPYAPLVAAAAGKVNGVLTIGADAPAIAQAFGAGFPVYPCETLARAVEQAHGLARSGDTVLLSPACASYDQFQNFEDRGDSFKRLVRAL